MSIRCPACRDGGLEDVLDLGPVPLLQMVPAGASEVQAPMGRFLLARCQGCGHLLNRRFDPSSAAAMYEGDVLSNVPVHDSMTRSLRGIADRLGPGLVRGKRVVEVGAGSGHLARILARQAASVVLFEPSRGLHPGHVAGPNIALVQDFFRASDLDGGCDLVVVRHVLEHVAEPARLLEEVASALLRGGRVYLELPRAEFIEAHAALFDLYYPHVHYFHEATVRRLAGSAGLSVERRWVLKGGHDVGLVLRRGRGDAEPAPRPAPGGAEALARALQARRFGARGLARGLPGRAALYGATWQGIAFLATTGRDRPYVAALDDNAAYEGRELYGATRRVPVVRPGAEALRGVDSVVVTAYLHDAVIRERLAALGFRGEVASLGPEAARAREEAHAADP